MILWPAVIETNDDFLFNRMWNVSPSAVSILAIESSVDPLAAAGGVFTICWEKCVFSWYLCGLI